MYKHGLLDNCETFNLYKQQIYSKFDFLSEALSNPILDIIYCTTILKSFIVLDALNNIELIRFFKNLFLIHNSKLDKKIKKK